MPKWDAIRQYVLSRKTPPEVAQKIAADYRAGDHSTTIAARYDLSISTVCRCLHEAGVPIRPLAETARKCSLNETVFDDPALLLFAARNGYSVGFRTESCHSRFAP